MGDRIMATTINADTSEGLKFTSDTSGELELQSGGITQTKITSSGLTDTNSNVITSQSGKNILINGDMRIDQRYSGSAVIAAADSQFVLDRWVGRTFSGSGEFSMQQVTDAPEGFQYSNKITVTTAATSGVGGYSLEQRIEGQNLTMLGYGTSGAKNLTVSFWIKASVVGTYSVSIRTSTGGVSGISTCKNTFTISVANTWQKVTNTFPANTAYDTIYNSTTGIFFDINFGAQTEKATNTLNSWEPGNFLYATGQTDVMQTLGATINITGVQLEVGEEATPFEHVPYDVNLQRCQRYCEVYDRNSSLCTSLAWTSANTSGPFLYKQKKRGIPTIIPSSLTAFTATAAGGGALPSTNVTAFNTNVDSMELQVIVEAGSLIPGHASILRVGDGTLTIDAEL